MAEEAPPFFLELFCEKNSDGTKNLRLKGKELQQRIGCRITNSDMTIVSKFLSNHANIVKLDLCYNDINAKGLLRLVKYYLKYENSLEDLNLAGCNLDGGSMKYLYNVAKTLRLKTLRVNGNKIGTEGGKFLAMLLEENDTITHLDIGDTDQTLSSIPYFCSVLRHDIGTNKTLQVLDISRIIPQGMYSQVDTGHLAEQLGNMLKVNPVLTELHVQKCQIDSHDIELFLIGLSYNKTLLLLDLGYNRIADDGIELLAKWLRTRPNLLGLNVAGNDIGNTGARALSFHMPFSRIRLLDISHNRIGDDGMIDILNTLKKPYTLRLFYIWGNNIAQRTFRFLERMFLSKVLEQENIDVKLYTVDDVLYHAYYPVNHYKHKYYCVMDHGCGTELWIKRNKIEDEHAQPRSLVKFKFYPRVPFVDDSIPIPEKPH